MIGPYQMVFINLIGSVLVFGITLFYKFIFPKKKINLLILLFIISALAVISTFRTGVYESGDFSLHIYRAMSFFQNLTDGNFIPSWAGKLNATYGYPLFIFLNPLPYYIVSFFHAVGFSFIASMKIFLIFCYMTSGIAMYFFGKKLFKNDLAAFTAAIFYLFSPYHLVDQHFRIDVGEILCYAILPLFLLCLYKLINEQKLIYILWSGLMLAFLIMSHQAMALMSLGLIIPIGATLIIGNNKINKINSLVRMFVAIFLGVGISAYIWIPYLAYSAYNLSSTLFSKLPEFVNIQQIFYSPWRLGFLFQGPKGELSFLIGYAQLFILIFLVIYLLLKKLQAKYAKELTIWLLTTAFLIFMLTSYSSIIWLTVPIIKNMLLSYRVLFVITLCLSVLAGYFALLNLNRKIIIYLIVIFTIGTTILNWGNRRVIPQITDTQLTNNLPFSSYQGEGLYYIGNTIWFSKKPIFINKLPINRVEVLQGKAKIQNLVFTSTKHSYIANSPSGAVLRENTLYYPGWTIFINGEQTTIDFKTRNNPGLIIFNISKGKSQISVDYKDLLIIQVLKIIFASSLFVILGYTLLTTYKDWRIITRLKKLRKRFA
jgi:4-amino-4-deoxy-L-arabinose transferase-like glycosyltransferase